MEARGEEGGERCLIEALGEVGGLRRIMDAREEREGALATGDGDLCGGIL